MLIILNRLCNIFLYLGEIADKRRLKLPYNEQQNYKIHVTIINLKPQKHNQALSKQEASENRASVPHLREQFCILVDYSQTQLVKAE